MAQDQLSAPAPHHHLYPRRAERARDEIDGEARGLDVAEVEIFATAPGGRYHVMDFLKRRADISEGSFFAELAREGDLLSRDADFRKAALRYCHSLLGREVARLPHEGQDHGYDAVIAMWTDSLDALARFHPDMRTRQSFYVDQEGSFSLIAIEQVPIDTGIIPGRNGRLAANG